jgi:hypothetical protein
MLPGVANCSVRQSLTEYQAKLLDYPYSFTHLPFVKKCDTVMAKFMFSFRFCKTRLRGKCFESITASSAQNGHHGGTARWLRRPPFYAE